MRQTLASLFAAASLWAAFNTADAAISYADLAFHYAPPFTIRIPTHRTTHPTTSPHLTMTRIWSRPITGTIVATASGQQPCTTPWWRVARIISLRTRSIIHAIGQTHRSTRSTRMIWKVCFLQSARTARPTARCKAWSPNSTPTSIRTQPPGSPLTSGHETVDGTISFQVDNGINRPKTVAEAKATA